MLFKEEFVFVILSCILYSNILFIVLLIFIIYFINMARASEEGLSLAALNKEID